MVADHNIPGFCAGDAGCSIATTLHLAFFVLRHYFFFVDFLTVFLGAVFLAGDFFAGAFFLGAAFLVVFFTTVTFLSGSSKTRVVYLNSSGKSHFFNLSNIIFCLSF